ncbi:MAG: hypothetical protein HZRFUVUK_002064, partial [Candidatus Fervidibacterota bacterium]
MIALKPRRQIRGRDGDTDGRFWGTGDIATVVFSLYDHRHEPTGDISRH